MNSKSDLGRSKDEATLASLMSASLSGDCLSYRSLLQRVSELLVVYVRNGFRRLGMANTGGEEDVVQEVLLAIHAKKSTFDKTQYFLPWMYAIARYKLIDHLRRNRVRIHSTVPLSDELDNLGHLLSEAPELSAESGQDLVRLLGTLPEKQRRVLEMVKIEGLSVADAAAKTGYSASDIKVTAHRALKALQKANVETKSSNKDPAR